MNSLLEEHLRKTITNGVRKGKITGAQDICKVLAQVFDATPEVVYTPEKLKILLEQAARDYELLVRRGME